MVYADDITITSTNTSTSAAKKCIPPYLHKVFGWTKQNNLILTPDKTSPTQTHNILQHSKAKKNTIFNNGRYTTNIPTDPHTVTTTDIKTIMRHIHTSIVSRHLATRGNNKILRTPPPHIGSSEERLPASLVAPLPSSEQTNLPSSNHTYTKSTPKHIHHHYAPSVTSTHTTHIISSTAPTYAPHCRPWICGQTPPE